MEYAVATSVELFRDEAIYITMKLIVQNNAQPFTELLSTSP